MCIIRKIKIRRILEIDEKTKIEILKYYVHSPEGEIKFFDRKSELIDKYINYIEDEGYVALGIEYKIKDSGVVKLVDLAIRDKENTWAYTKDKDELIKSLSGFEADEIKDIAKEMLVTAERDQRAKEEGRVFVMRCNGYAFTKSQIMYANSLKSDEDFNKFMEEYERAENKTGWAVIIDKALERYEYYSNTTIL